MQIYLQDCQNWSCEKIYLFWQFIKICQFVSNHSLIFLFNNWTLELNNNFSLRNLFCRKNSDYFYIFKKCLSSSKIMYLSIYNMKRKNFEIAYGDFVCHFGCSSGLVCNLWRGRGQMVIISKFMVVTGCHSNQNGS